MSNPQVRFLDLTNPRVWGLVRFYRITSVYLCAAVTVDGILLVLSLK